MADNLSYGLFALNPEALTNDAQRPGALLFELHKITWTPNNTTAVEVELISKFGKGNIPSTDLIGVEMLTSRGTAVVFGASVAQSSTTGQITVSLNASTTYSTATTMWIKVYGLSRGESYLLKSPTGTS